MRGRVGVVLREERKRSFGDRYVTKLSLVTSGWAVGGGVRVGGGETFGRRECLIWVAFPALVTKPFNQFDVSRRLIHLHKTSRKRGAG